MEYKLTDTDIYELLSMLHTSSLASEEREFTSNEFNRIRQASADCLSKAIEALKDPDLIGFRLTTIDKNGYFTHAAFGDTVATAQLLLEEYERNLKLQISMSDAQLSMPKEKVVAHAKQDPLFILAIEELKALIRKPTNKDNFPEVAEIPKDSVTIQ